MHPRKKIYLPGSPGEARAKLGITLAHIKREIAASPAGARHKTRLTFVALGLLVVRADG